MNIGGAAKWTWLNVERVRKKTALRNELSLTKVIFKLSIEMKIEIITRFSVKFDINFR